MAWRCILCFDFLGFYIDFLNFRFPFHYFFEKKWKLASILKIFQSSRLSSEFFTADNFFGYFKAFARLSMPKKGQSREFELKIDWQA